VREDPVASLAGLWRKVWASGAAGSEVVLQVRRENETLTARILSVDRTQFLKAPSAIRLRPAVLRQRRNPAGRRQEFPIVSS